MFDENFLILHQISPSPFVCITFLVMDVKIPKNIIQGFGRDFEEISEDFKVLSPDLNLKEFFTYWTDKSLDCIFANRFDPRELLESISEINRFLVEVIVDSSDQDDSKKLVALFFILCLCVKQPVRLRRKIRCNCDDIISLGKLCTRNHQAMFAWNELKSMQVVDVVEDRTIYGPSMLNNRGSKRGLERETTNLDSMAEEKQDGLNFLENKIEPILKDIDSMCGPYEQMKLSLKLDEYADSTVELVSNGSMSEFIDEAKQILYEFKSESNEERLFR